MTVGSRQTEGYLQLSMPFYVMEWKMRAGCPKKAFECFLGTGAPFPGVKMQRFHAPGSVNGWIIAETDDITAIYAHAAEW